MPRAPRIPSSISLGIVLALAFGLIRGAVTIAAQNYYGNGLWFLALRQLQNSVNRYFGLLLALSVVLLLRHYLLASLKRASEVSQKRTFLTRPILRQSIDAVALGILAGVVSVELFPVFRTAILNAGVLWWSPSQKAALLGGLVIMVAAATVLAGRFHFMEACERTFQAVARKELFGVLSILSLGILLVLNLSALVARSSANPRRTNILLITIDTLRADHLKSYGYYRNTSPRIDDLSTRGVLFERAISQAPWTLPSLATVFTGLYPSKHGALHHTLGIRSDIATLAELLQNRRYRTIGIISNTFTSSSYGFHQGFEVFDQSTIGNETHISSDRISELAIKRLRTMRGSPFFLWLHYFDPHDAYMRHEEFQFGEAYPGPPRDAVKVSLLQKEGVENLEAADIQLMMDFYDSEIQFTDHQIGRVLDAIHDYGLQDQTLVALTADHGEQFMERGGLRHGKLVYDELIRVPLVLYDPRRPELAGSRIQTPVELRSLFSTLLKAAGAGRNQEDETDLLEIASGNQTGGACFTEGSYAWGQDKRKVGIIAGHWKLIYHLDDGSSELFDLERDPAESINLIDSESEVLADLFPLVESWLTNQGSEASGATVELTEEESERLRSLGYLQ